jgi:similar to stage IV sporulation protein
MLLNVWKYAKGYVTVQVTGFALERFLNMAAYRGVYLWDVTRTPSGVTLSVSIPGFKLLTVCAKKTKSKIRILQKKGFPFFVHRYRHRKILWGGIVFFVLALYGLSSFVWRIDIVGHERVEQEALLAFSEQHGLKVGAFKYRVNHRQLQQDLQLNFADIAWADVHTRGTRTTITISESIPRQRVIDKSTPCHIVATKDGVISGIVTGAGKPVVRQYDVVKQGELLVSGALEHQSDLHGTSLSYVHAYAEVWAKRFTPIQFFIPFEYTEKKYTERSKTRYGLQILFADSRLISLPHSSTPFDSYDKITTRKQPGASGDYPLPFIWHITRYDEFVLETKTRDAQAAVELADRMLTNRILREFDFEADIVDKSIKLFQTADGLRVEAIITTNERIDAAVPINTHAGGNTLPPAPTKEDETASAFEPFE